MGAISLRRKLVIVFTMLIIILGAFIGYYSYENAKSMVIKNKESEMADTINRVDININSWVLEVTKLAQTETTKQLLTGLFAENQSADSRKESILYEESVFSDFFQIVEAMSDVIVLDMDGSVRYRYQDGGTIQPDKNRLRECYQTAGKNPAGENWLGIGASLFMKDDVVTLVKAVQKESKQQGLLVIELNPDSFSRLLLSNQSMLKNQYTFIVDKDGEIVCSNKKLNPEFLSVIKPYYEKRERKFEMRWDGSQYYAVSQYNGLTGWQTCSAVAVDDIFPQADSLRNTIAVMVILSVLTASAVVLFSSYTFTKPVKQLVQAMKQVEKENFEITIPTKSRDEMGHLIASFNFMVSKIRQLVYEVYQEKLAQKDAEIEALQAQINPHFLYNTLDSINWMLIEQGELEISDVIISLGNIMRYSIGDKMKLVPFERELQYIRSYLLIQKNRLEERLRYEFQIDEESKKCMVPKLILQPIVENAVIHGVEPRKEGGLVVIRSFMENGSLMIQVSDDGGGIREEELERIKVWLYTKDDSAKSIGMRNIRRRIELYYGEKDSIGISSAYGQGTTVTLKIPMNERNKNEGESE